MKTQRQISVNVAAEVLQERLYQISREGFDPYIDDTYRECQLPMAAAVYALHDTPKDKSLYIHGKWKTIQELFWPFMKEWFKPVDRRRNLVKAGALILAEIERIDRVDREVRKDVS